MSLVGEGDPLSDIREQCSHTHSVGHAFMMALLCQKVAATEKTEVRIEYIHYTFRCAYTSQHLKQTMQVETFLTKKNSFMIKYGMGKYLFLFNK